ATAYPFPSSGLRWGATAGGYAEYWLRPAWSITAGLAWRRQALDHGSTDTLATSSYQLRYRFGYEEQSFRREDRTLHFLEFPLGLHWHYRAWQLEAGATFGRLLALRAVEIRTSRSSLIPTPEATERNMLGKTSSYRRQYVAAFAGLGWQPLRRLQLEIRGTYRPGALLQPSIESTIPAGGFWLDAGLRWQIFSDDRIRVRR
ncbi:MAG: outer membrane beta-barrel protein, partial [Saprospiraceae bacterium]